MKLALGTVQFGLPYGAFNTTGQVQADEAARILDAAQAAGINTLDSARAYGNSEEILGQLNAARRFRIVTKVSSLAGQGNPTALISSSIRNSLTELRTERLDALMLHDADDLMGSDADAIWGALETHKAAGVVGKIGVSVYSSATAEELSARFPIDIIQLPVNIFDQQAVLSGALDRLHDKDIEIHARSVFLQGFALADPDLLPGKLARFRDNLTALQCYAREHSLSPMTVALWFVLKQASIEKVVVGVTSVRELNEVISSANQIVDTLSVSHLATSDLSLINPGLWKEDCDA
jgi:aryl-alcohol dehydrogenase-like predicted oxidoreductase